MISIFTILVPRCIAESSEDVDYHTVGATISTSNWATRPQTEIYNTYSRWPFQCSHNIRFRSIKPSTSFLPDLLGSQVTLPECFSFRLYFQFRLLFISILTFPIEVIQPIACQSHHNNPLLISR